MYFFGLKMTQKSPNTSQDFRFGFKTGNFKTAGICGEINKQSNFVTVVRKQAGVSGENVFIFVI